MNDANCTESNCPHRDLLAKARAACLACPRGGRPAGHGGQVSMEAAGERIVNRERAYIDRTPRGQVTALPRDVEEKTAELYRRWCGLDTIDALLALHVSNGGTCDTFGAYLIRVRSSIDALRPERPAMRATAWAKFKALVRRFAMFDKVRSWDDGHGGAIRKEREAARDPLFDGYEHTPTWLGVKRRNV